MNYYSMFKVGKTYHFQVWFLYKSDLRIFTTGKDLGIIKIERFLT